MCVIRTVIRYTHDILNEHKCLPATSTHRYGVADPVPEAEDEEPAQSSSAVARTRYSRMLGEPVYSQPPVSLKRAPLSLGAGEGTRESSRRACVASHR